MTESNRMGYADSLSVSIVSGVVVSAISGVAGYLTGSFDLVMSFAASDPAACALWSAFAFAVGATASFAFVRLSSAFRRKRREEHVDMVFASMPIECKAIVHRAMVEGSVTVFPYDGDATHLMDAGILCCAPYGSITEGVKAYVRPEIAGYLKENADRFFK